MRFRTLALALALACGFTALGEAKKSPAVMRVKSRGKASSSRRVKPRKVQKHKAAKRRVTR
jgi:hypothetical protein